jgi:NAD(P)-dependent dehydrogenase (short-subunit alcohol dehydrogenase family)
LRSCIGEQGDLRTVHADLCDESQVASLRTTIEEDCGALDAVVVSVGANAGT